MNYETMNDFKLSHGTSRRGVVLSTYAELVETFGKPLPGDGDKTRAEWVVLFRDDMDRDVVATIYDWRRDEPLESVTLWTIGGFYSDCVDLVEGAIAFVKDMKAHENEDIMHQWDFEWAEEAMRNER